MVGSQPLSSGVSDSCCGIIPNFYKLFHYKRGTCVEQIWPQGFHKTFPPFKFIAAVKRTWTCSSKTKRDGRQKCCEASRHCCLTNASTISCHLLTQCTSYSPPPQLIVCTGAREPSRLNGNSRSSAHLSCTGCLFQIWRPFTLLCLLSITKEVKTNTGTSTKAEAIWVWL